MGAVELANSGREFVARLLKPGRADIPLRDFDEAGAVGGSGKLGFAQARAGHEIRETEAEGCFLDEQGEAGRRVRLIQRREAGCHVISDTIAALAVVYYHAAP